MLINLFGFILLIVITVFSYKIAKEYGRNAIVWTLITLAVGFGIQIILPIFILIVIAVAATVIGSSTQKIQDEIPIVTISVICIILSLVAGFLILRHLAKLPEDGFDIPPAPPSDFN